MQLYTHSIFLYHCALCKLFVCVCVTYRPTYSTLNFFFFCSAQVSAMLKVYEGTGSHATSVMCKFSNVNVSMQCVTCCPCVLVANI